MDSISSTTLGIDFGSHSDTNRKKKKKNSFLLDDFSLTF
jgi:hypothetical protein